MIEVPAKYHDIPTTIVHLPLAFVRSGHADVHSAQMRDVGQYGYDWSPTSRLPTYAYTLHFNSGGISPSSTYNYNRWLGFPLRCRTTTIVHLPLAFIRSGNILLDFGREPYASGDRGSSRSRTIRSFTEAYELGFNPSIMNQAYIHDHWLGFPLR